MPSSDGQYKWSITDNTETRLENRQSWIPLESDIVEEQYDDRSWAYLQTAGSNAVPPLSHWWFPWGQQTEPPMVRKRDDALRCRTSWL